MLQSCMPARVRRHERPEPPVDGTRAAQQHDCTVQPDMAKPEKAMVHALQTVHRGPDVQE